MRTSLAALAALAALGLALLPLAAQAEPAAAGAGVEITINNGCAPEAVAPDVAPAAVAPAPLCPAAAPAATSAPPEDAPHFFVGLGLGPAAWGPNIGVAISDTLRFTVSLIPVVVPGDFAMGHAGLRVDQTLKTRNRTELYGSVGIGVSGHSGDGALVAFGPALGIRTLPEADERLYLWAEARLNLIVATRNGPMVAPIPAAGIAWGF